MLRRMLQTVRRWWPAPAHDPYAGLQAGPWPVEAANDAQAYGVSIQPMTVLPGNWYWQATHVHHLTPPENGGNHHIYMDLVEPVLDEQGHWTLQRLVGGRLKATWEGGEQILVIDKPAGEPGTNLPLWRNQECKVWAIGQPASPLPSDVVAGIHTGHPDEGAGNTLFHHSFSITFQKVQAPPASKPIPGSKPLAHYVLLGPAEHPATLANLWLAQDYLLAFHPAFGFSPDEAATADLVTILAEEAAVGPEIIDRLTAAGTRVHRISGTSSEVAQALARRVAQGER
jgi:hypothetical protein